MPNWATTRLNITGPREEIDALLRNLMPESEDRDAKIAAIGTEVSHLPMTFEGLVPVPKAIKEIPEKGDVELGLLAISSGADDRLRLMDQSPKNDWLPPELVATETRVRQKHGLEGLEGSALSDAALKIDPDCIRAAAATIRAKEQTGFVGWFDWTDANWGTKWDVEDADYQRINDGEVTILFETAWSEPGRFLEKMAETYPGLSFSGAAVEPGNLHAVMFSGDEGDFQSWDADYGEAYEEVYGEPAPEDEDEDEDDFDDEGDDFDGESPNGP
jgi:hypothetical protein